jgi:predicted amidophosphoribosyltransferase
MVIARSIIRQFFPCTCCGCGVRWPTELCDACICLFSVKHAKDVYYLGDYTNPVVARAVYSWKAESRHGFSNLVARIFLSSGIFGSNSCFTYVPARKKGWEERGYHPAQDLAHALAGMGKGTAVHPPVIRGSGPRLTFADASVRKSEAVQQYQSVLLPKPSITSLFLCDDVTTTGSTLETVCQRINQAWPDIAIQKITVAHGR